MGVRDNIRVQFGAKCRRADAESRVTVVNKSVPGRNTTALLGSVAEGMGAEGTYGSVEDMVPILDKEVPRAHKRVVFPLDTSCR